MAFTKEQQLAIDKDGTNIIVSAGAGSGKTAVLTERVIRKIKDGIDVNRLLVLTFTNEAAGEMKKRIRDKIIENNLDSQLELLDSAYITTFDSYALSLVKKYNYLINVSDDLKIIDGSIITIYKNKVLDEIFESMYGNPLFDKLISDFSLKDDYMIKQFILEVSNKLDLLVDKEGYIDNYFINICSDSFISKCLDDYHNIIKNKIDELRSIYNRFTSYINGDLESKLTEWLKPLFNGNSYDDYRLFLTMEVPRFTKVDPLGLELKDELKKCTDEIKELLSYSGDEEIISGIKKTYDYIKVILDIVKLLDAEVLKYKDKYNVYEFNDISHMAIKIVRDNLEVREELKEYFNEIMVDEYQDTSDIQEAFLSYIGNNNIYMVGDIKQSIYRFRNANPYIFSEKYNAYSKNIDGIKIDLIKNFRSRKEVINNINEIFNLIMDNDIGNANYLKEHNMVFGNTFYDIEDNKVSNNLEIYNYELDKEEVYTKEEKELFIISNDILDKIKNNYQVLDKKTNKLRTIKYSDICIITDRNKYLETYKKILEYHNIPSVIYMDSTITNDMVVLVFKNLIDLVWHVNNKIFDDKFRYLFTSVARSNLFCYDDNKIYHINNDKCFYDDEIFKLASEIDIDNTINEVVNDIIDKFKIYERMLILPNINENIIKISNMIDIINNLSSLGYTIPDIVDYIDNTINLDLPITYSVRNNGEDAVKIMNIHKSKGLEFSLCYYTGIDNRFTISDIASNMLVNAKYGIIMPYLEDDELKDTILKKLFVNDFYKEEVSEKIRLFYVALTRCREKMIILANIDNSNGYNSLVPYDKRIKYRSFLDILNSIKVIDKYIVNKDAVCTHDYHKITLKEINKSKSNVKIEKRRVNVDHQKLDNKHFSKEKTLVSSIEDIKRMEYGTKIHEELEYSNFINPDNEYVEALLKEIPEGYINTYHEYEFSYIYSDTKYNGIIDLMVEYDDMIYIIDYKLKSISDEAYNEQLNGYRNYIESITDKKVKIYLYSITDNTLKEVL